MYNVVFLQDEICCQDKIRWDGDLLSLKDALSIHGLYKVGCVIISIKVDGL